MKLLIIGLLGIGAFAATAANSGLTGQQAENSVIRAAHSYIARQAPDWGGSVKSPCAEDLKGDNYTVVCEGKVRLTTAGEGELNRKFECTGSFHQGHDGRFYKEGSIACRTK